MRDTTLQRQRLETIRTSSALTAEYVAGEVIEINNKSQCTLLVEFTIGSLTSMTLKFEVSYDGITYYQLPVMVAGTGGDSSPSLETITLSATANWAFNMYMHNLYLKVSAIGTGTVTDSLLAIQAVISDM